MPIKMHGAAHDMTAREVAEQKRIDEKGGIENLKNKRNPIGEKRRFA